MTLTSLTAPSPSDRRISRLNRVSSDRPIEPDTHLPWGTLGPGQVIADELLSIEGLLVDGEPVPLTAEQRARLSREEVAAMLTMGVHFEAVLTAGFARQIAETSDVSDPRVTYMLHEIGEEARHSRAFVRLIDELAPIAKNPIDTPVANFVINRLTRSLARTDALLLVMVLAGEEIPDHLQQLAAEHPQTDPFLAALNRYHRMEEARHLSFARTVLPEAWARAGWIERQRIRVVAPVLIGQLWQAFVHPGVYATVGLPPWRSWKAVQQLPRRIELRRSVTRPVLDALLDAGRVRPGAGPTWVAGAVRRRLPRRAGRLTRSRPYLGHGRPDVTGTTAGREAALAAVRAIEPFDSARTVRPDRDARVDRERSADPSECRAGRAAGAPRRVPRAARPGRAATLLVDHRTAGLWLPPGGHVDPGEDPGRTVARELDEELGIEAPLLPGLSSNPFFLTRTTTVGIDGGHLDVSLWYVLDVPAGRPLHPDLDEFTSVRWWPVDSARTLAHADPHLPRFLAKLTAELGHGTGPATVTP